MKKLIIVFCISIQFTINAQQYTVASIPYVALPDTGTNCLAADDMFSSILPLGFNFCYYGNMYDSCVIGTNGVITFDTSYANSYCSWSSSQLPIPFLPNLKNTIMGAYYDIDIALGGAIRYYTIGVAPSRKFVVSFDSVPLYSCQTLFATQQIILYEGSNIVEMHILNKPSCVSWNNGGSIEGMLNSNGTEAIVVAGRNAGTWSCTNDGQRFTPTFWSCYAGITSDSNPLVTKLYPNPSNGIINIESDNSIINSQLEIYNIWGELILSKKLMTKKSQIDISDQQKGMYIYVLKYSTKVISTGKIVLQ